MTSKNSKIFTKEEIEHAIKSTFTMGGAAKYLNADWRTFKKEAEKYGLYNPVKQKNITYSLRDILEGKHPQYPTSKIGRRLVKEGYKEYVCEGCGLGDMWNSKSITLELDHKDGDNSNHRLENLRFLCPNCHSQTDTYRSKKLKLFGK